MQSTYAGIHQMLNENSRWVDRAPQMPMVGFAVGTVLSLMLWGIIGWGAWRLFL